MKLFETIKSRLLLLQSSSLKMHVVTLKRLEDNGFVKNVVIYVSSNSYVNGLITILEERAFSNLYF